MKSGNTVVVSGANSGIGFEVARHFARNGAKVVMACRSLARGEEAQGQLHAEIPDAETVVLPLDVSELDSIGEFASRFAAEVGEFSTLINNAGVAVMPLARTSVGHEIQLATNYLGAFTLTGALLPYMRGEGRIVNVGSIAHRFGRLDMDDLNWENTPYDPWKAYARSKVALLSHTLELNRRLQANDRPIVALAAHPGVAATNIGDKSERIRAKGPIRAWYMNRMRSIIPSAERAASSVILAASAEHARGGDYFGPGGLFEIGGRPAPAKIHPAARDPELGKRLWEVSQALTGMHYLT